MLKLSIRYSKFPEYVLRYRGVRLYTCVYIFLIMSVDSNNSADVDHDYCQSATKLQHTGKIQERHSHCTISRVQLVLVSVPYRIKLVSAKKKLHAKYCTQEKEWKYCAQRNPSAVPLAATAVSTSAPITGKGKAKEKQQRWALSVLGKHQICKTTGTSTCKGNSCCIRNTL